MVHPMRVSLEIDRGDGEYEENAAMRDKEVVSNSINLWKVEEVRGTHLSGIEDDVCIAQWESQQR